MDDVLDRLIQNATDTENLGRFLAKNSNSLELSDFFISQSYRDLLLRKEQIEKFILSKQITYSNLDFSRSNNSSFLSYLLDFSERVGLITEFELLFNLHKEKQLEISSRLIAGSKYFIGIRTIQNYFDRITEIIELLKRAYFEEEDDSDIIIATFLNFYAQVVHNFASQNKFKVTEFQKKLIKVINLEDYLFLNTDLTRESLSIPIADNVTTYNTIQQLLDEYLSRTKTYLPFNVQTLLIEGETDYSNLLNDIEKSFNSLQNLCSKLYQKIASNTIYNSLMRGVAVLTESNQLLGYMYSYGKMHNAKIVSAFSEADFPNDLFHEDLEIYDWGCGQGIATFIFYEYYEIANSNTILIEPSELALKRAALHITKIAPETAISTINKDLDSLLDEDFASHPTKTKVHLFSNILDVESFSMSQLLELINRNFKGINYFICTSPRVDQRRTNRLDNFMESFRNHKNFKDYVKIDNTFSEWKNGWTRSIRVFKAEI